MSVDSGNSSPTGGPTPREQMPPTARAVTKAQSTEHVARRPALIGLAQLTAIGLAAAAGAGLIAFGLDQGSLPPRPPTSAGPAPLDSAEQVERARAHELGRSPPLRLDIPAIDVHADVVRVSLAADGSLAAPPIDRAMSVGWYTLGPTPGEPGAAVVLGHVDAEGVGPAVFYRIGKLEPGSTLSVTRADGSRAVFTVTGGASYPKDELPYERIFADLDYPTLRLVTCGAPFDDHQRTWENNVVVYAVLTDSRPR
jgi:sortase (surface protein transpeptidase)